MKKSLLLLLPLFALSACATINKTSSSRIPAAADNQGAFAQVSNKAYLERLVNVSLDYTSRVRLQELLKILDKNSEYILTVCEHLHVDHINVANTDWFENPYYFGFSDHKTTISLDASAQMNESPEVREQSVLAMFALADKVFPTFNSIAVGVGIANNAVTHIEGDSKVVDQKRVADLGSALTAYEPQIFVHLKSRDPQRLAFTLGYTWARTDDRTLVVGFDKEGICPAISKLTGLPVEKLNLPCQ